MCTLIQLKFKALIMGPKANLSSKFKMNLINFLRVMINFKHKAKSNFCHAYTLNQLEEQVENQYITRLT